MGTVNVGEYVEPGYSGQSIEKRPFFQDLLERVIEQRDVDYVVIYMRSRIFRNYIEAAIVKQQLAKLGVKLVSAKEDFGDGYMAEAMEAVTDVFNWLQVRISGEDIKTKMANKARNGGTIGRAPVGYLNTTKLIDGRKINTIMTDPERAKYVVMAFELFATGQETYETLCTKLTQAGFRMPMTGRYKGGPISTTKIAILLRDRYYAGYISYKGIEYRGRHEPLITEELFDDVQNMLAKHTESHVRHRTHNHYLRGLLWCGRCKHRLVVTYVQGRHGGEYYYFYCRGRQQGLCDLPGIPIEVLEDAVAAYYQGALTLPADWLAELRDGVDQAVNANADMTDTLRDQYAARLVKLEQKESYFLDLAAEEGWPKDNLRAKIDGVRTEQREIHDTLERSAGQLDHSRTIFHHAFDLLTEPHHAYQAGDEVVRGLLNKAFFTRLYVDGGKVIDHQAEEPFNAILDGYRTYQVTRTTTKSAAATISHDAPEHHSTGSPSTLAGQVCDKPSTVELRGLEPLTPTLPVGRHCWPLTWENRDLGVSGHLHRGSPWSPMADRINWHTSGTAGPSR
jgi:DNA invertase Pin-like site-specific DNA recombinase